MLIVPLLYLLLDLLLGLRGVNHGLLSQYAQHVVEGDLGCVWLLQPQADPILLVLLDLCAASAHQSLLFLLGEVGGEDCSLPILNDITDLEWFWVLDVVSDAFES